VDRAAGAETVGAAAQDHGIARFQAQHAGIGCDIGAAFEDHGDDAERDPHAFDGHAVRALPAFGHDAHGIDNITHGRDAVGHRVDARLGQRQPIDEGGACARGAHFRDILGVCGKDKVPVGADRALHAVQRTIFLLRRCQRQHPRGGAGAASQVGHQGRQIVVCLDGLQRRAHVGSSSWLRSCPSTEIAILRSIRNDALAFKDSANGLAGIKGPGWITLRILAARADSIKYYLLAKGCRP